MYFILIILYIFNTTNIIFYNIQYKNSFNLVEKINNRNKRKM